MPVERRSNPDPEKYSGGKQTSAGATGISNMTDYFFREVSDMRERENNLLIYGAPESASQVAKERVEHDRRFVKSLIELCDAEHDETKFFVFRLGKVSALGGKPRPLHLAGEAERQ